MAITFNTAYYQSCVRHAKSTGGGTVRDFPLNYGYVDFFADNPSVDDACYFALIAEGKGCGLFTGLRFVYYFTGIVSVSHTIVWEYYNGTTWSALPGISDGTNGLRQTGDVTWNMPGDWAIFDYLENQNSYYHLKTFWIRARLSAFNTVTEGGNTYISYDFVRPYIISATGEWVTPASLKAASDSGGWGAVLLEGKTYVFVNGLYLDGNCTFVLFGEDIQFGMKDIAMFFAWIYEAKWIVNIYSSFKASDRQTIITLYTGNNPNTDYFLFGSINSDSILNNVLARIVQECANKSTTPMYRMILYCGEKQTYNFTAATTAYPQGSPNFERCNFIAIQYILSTPKAKYKNCYFYGSFNIDGDYLPTVEDSTFDGKYSWEFWYAHWLGDGLAAGFIEVIDCQWPNGNKLMNNGWPYGVSGSYNYRCLYSHRFNLKVTDKTGNPIQGATIKLTDAYGNGALKTELANNYATSGYLIGDTTFPVTDSSPFIVGRYYDILGEIMLCTGKPTGTSITVARAQLGTLARRLTYGLVTYVRFSLIEDLVTTANGNIHECKVLELAKYRAGEQDTYIERTHTPFTLTIEKEGYQIYEAKIDITEKIDWEIALNPPTYVTEDIFGEADEESLNGDVAVDVGFEGMLEEVEIYGEIHEEEITG